MNTVEFLKTESVVNVSLPKDLFMNTYRDYVVSNPQQKGIAVEMLYTLGLKRIFKDESHWPLDKFEPFDFVINDICLDVKTTAKKYYRNLKTQRGVEAIKKTGHRLVYTLVTPEEWDQEKAIVKLRVHEICIFDEKGRCEKIKLKGSYKSFKF